MRVGPRTTMWALRSLAAARNTPVVGPRPVTRLSAPLVASAVLDEFVGAAFIATRPSPRDTELARMAGDLDAAVAYWDARGWIDKPVSYHREPPALRNGDVTLRPARWGAWRYDHISFPSRFRPRPDEPGATRWGVGDTVHGAVLRHGDGTDRPWLVLLHGYGMGYAGLDIHNFRAQRLHTELGVNVVLPAMPHHGPRRGNRNDQLLSFDIVQNVHNITQAAWDTRRLIGWIRSITDQPVALSGLSMGAYLTGLVSGLDDVDLAIAGIPTTDLEALLHNHAPTAVRKRARSAGSIGPNSRAAMSLVSPLAVTPRVPRDRRFIFAGLGDRMSTPEQAEQLWEHWDRPAIHWFPSGHLGCAISGDGREFATDALTRNGFAA